MSRSALLLLVVVSIVLGACRGDDDQDAADATATGIPRAAADSGSIEWEPCFEEAQCGTLNVPLDHSREQGRTIAISLLRRAAPPKGPWQGVLLVNPGGPGASGVSMAFDAPYLFPREIMDRFDIVGFDPRGVGGSAPVNCGEDSERDYVLDNTPNTEHERKAIANDVRDWAEACVRESGDLLTHVNTVATAKDMDLIREALGVEQISYFGWSYGTLLGAVYAELFPQRVRAMVLDGAIDPTLTFDQAQEETAAALEAAFAAFIDDCGSRRACDYYSDGDPGSAYDKLMAAIENNQIPAAAWEGDAGANAEDASNAVVSALYSRDTWPQLAFALVTAQRDHDSSALLYLAYGSSDEGEESNYPAARMAIICGDQPTDEDIAHFHDLSKRFVESWPRIGATAAYWSAACAFWPDPAERLSEDIDADGAGPILVIGTRIDPATPYVWAKRLASQLEPARLLTYEGYGHTAAFVLVSDCVDEIALRLLVDLAEPDDGETCTYPD